MQIRLKTVFHVGLWLKLLNIFIRSTQTTATVTNHRHNIFPTKAYLLEQRIKRHWHFVPPNRIDQKYRIYIGYHAKTSEIVAFVWGKRDLQTALALKQRLKALKVSYERIAGDNWDAFVNAFSDTGDQWVGKQHTKAIEGNNCRIRHRLSRAIRRSCCFSKSMFYHVKSFNIGFWAINHPK